MKSQEYLKIPTVLTNRWENALGDVLNQMYLKKVLVISDVPDDMDNAIYKGDVTRIKPDFGKLPYKDNTFEAVCLLYSCRRDEAFDHRLAEMKRVCKERKYVFVMDTFPPDNGFGKIISNKFVHENTNNYGRRAQELTDYNKVKEAMTNAGLSRVSMKYLLFHCACLMTSYKAEESK